LPLSVAGIAFIGLLADRYKDWRSLSFLEGRLNEDETERDLHEWSRSP
jgi:hypothetical protein